MTRERYAALAGLLPRGRVLFDESMARHTSFRVGGPADALIYPENAAEIAAVVLWCAQQDIPWIVIGNGTNLLVRDGGIRGVVLKLSERMHGIAVEQNRLTAQAGASLTAAARAALAASLTGLEFASGIPGSVGGAVVMNAGAYGGAMEQVVRRVEVMDPDGAVRWLDGAEMRFGYRHSRCAQERLTVLAAEMELNPGDADLIEARMRELAAQRREKQPLNLPSAGSTFKRPEGHFAGKLIEEAGLKGERVGGAQISELHAGFIVNMGGATAADILALMQRVADAVERRTGIRMEPEVRILGEDR
ncbi:MAG: UDP-N-acetylmuramate dehydrogenase [Christensenellales bacterium]|jgi:UDP-N-acetylmuramate dehydrogenase